MAIDIETLTGTDATDFNNVLRKHWVPNTTIPAVADFSWVNQGAASAVDIADVGIHMHHTFTTGNNARCLVKTMPATPYTVEVILECTQYFQSFVNAGVVLRDSGSGRLLTGGYQCVGGIPTIANGWRWNSPTSLNATAHFLSNGTYAGRTPIGFRIADDGTNHTYYASLDGVVWHQMGSVVSRTAWLASPNQIGIYIENVLSSGSVTAYSGGAVFKSFRTF